MKGSPTGFWGKLKPREGPPEEWHPLADHCADVAACAEALLERTLLGRRLATIAGQQELNEAQIARLCVLAALHDIGKFNIGFQNKKLGRRAPFVAGHLGEVLGLMFVGGIEAHDLLWGVMPGEELGDWGEDMKGLLCATISHHGRPVTWEQQIDPRCWRPEGGLDPFVGMAELVAATRRWFPVAWRPDGSQLPTDPAFQHAWSGLLMLADWLGSDEARFFPFSEGPSADRMSFSRRQAREAMRVVGLDTEPPRLALGQELIGYDRLPGRLEPRPAQARILDVPLDSAGSLVVLEAETGSGKTEAALVRFLRLYQEGLVDGMYFALPTRTAASQIHERVRAALAHAFPEGTQPPVVLAVPGYIQVDEVRGVPLPGFEVQWPDDPELEWRSRGWAAEHPKRFLAGAVVVGTVDQALLSALTVSHAHMRSTALLRHLLVVDEVHASDVYMDQLMRTVLETHVGAGGHALLMSATLGSRVRSQLVYGRGRAAPPDLAQSAREPYPLVSVRSSAGFTSLPVASSGTVTKEVLIELVPSLDDPEAVARLALEAAGAGGRVLVVRNTVSGCLAVQKALEALAEAGGRGDLLFRCQGVIAPHHSRFARPDRELLDRTIETEYGKERPEGLGLLAVATQTVEQSLDLDADLLVTDLCPIDVLLQRIGRLHRHGGRQRPAHLARARCLVLVPDEGDLSSLLKAGGTVRGRHGLGSVYDDLLALQATWNLLGQNRKIEIPGDNRRLVELGTHPEALAALAATKDGSWPAHLAVIDGFRRAEAGLAELNVLRRDRSFSDPARCVLFPDDRRAPTRLGEEDRLARFIEGDAKRPVTGPFGATFTELRIPGYLAQRLGLPPQLAEASEVVERPGEVRFRYGTAPFVYDRFGLRLEES
jgi:CRISPR-associated endonuclease/helicase Cas3